MSAEEVRQGLFIFFFVIFILCLLNVFCGKLKQVMYYEEENGVVRIENAHDIQQVPPKYQDLDLPPPYENNII